MINIRAFRLRLGDVFGITLFRTDDAVFFLVVKQSAALKPHSDWRYYRGMRGSQKRKQKGLRRGLRGN